MHLPLLLGDHGADVDDFKPQRSDGAVQIPRSTTLCLKLHYLTVHCKIQSNALPNDSKV